MQQTDLGLNLSTKSTRKRVFLAQMDRVMPWGDLVAVVSPYTRESKTGRPPFAVLTMLRIHFMQQWLTLSDPAMEEALHDMPLFRDFAGLTLGQRLPDETTILRFRHLLEKHKLADQILATINDLLQRKGLMLKTGTAVDATLIAAPSSTKNKTGERDPDMHQTKKGNQWHFGMKAHIGVDADSGMVHTVRGGARAAQVPRAVGQSPEPRRVPQALKIIGRLCDFEGEVQEGDANERHRIRQRKSRPVAGVLHRWLLAKRREVPDGSATARAIDYSLKRWQALMRYIGDGDLPIENNWVENHIRPIGIGNNWLFTGSLRAGQCAAAVMRLVHSARMNGHDPYAYLKGVLERLPTHPASRVEELLPHRWAPATDRR